jgi:hypothetical protein
MEIIFEMLVMLLCCVGGWTIGSYLARRHYDRKLSSMEEHYRSEAAMRARERDRHHV